MVKDDGVDPFRKLNPEDIAATGTRYPGAFREILRDSLAECAYLLLEQDTHAPHVTVIASRFQKLCNRRLRQAWTGDTFTLIELRPMPDAVRPAETTSVWELRIPESARRQFLAGNKKLMENNCAKAVDHLKKAIQTYAEYGDAHRAMGECYALADEIETAEREFKLALEQPHMPDLHLLLGKIYARQANEGLLVRQLELYLAEEKPGPMRDRMRALLKKYGYD